MLMITDLGEGEIDDAKQRASSNNITNTIVTDTGAILQGQVPKLFASCKWSQAEIRDIPARSELKLLQMLKLTDGNELGISDGDTKGEIDVLEQTALTEASYANGSKTLGPHELDRQETRASELGHSGQRRIGDFDTGREVQMLHLRVTSQNWLQNLRSHQMHILATHCLQVKKLLAY